MVLFGDILETYFQFAHFIRLDFDLIQKYRTEIPTFKQRRTDIYDITAK